MEMKIELGNKEKMTEVSLFTFKLPIDMILAHQI